MSADRRGATIVERVPLSPVGLRRIDHTLALMMSGFGALFCIECVPSIVMQWRAIDSALGLLDIVLLAGVVLFAGVAAVVRTWIRPAFLTAGTAYLVALLLWPALVTSRLPATATPWVASIATVFCGFVIMAHRGWLIPLGYSALVSAVCAYLRTTPSGGGAHPYIAALTGCYTFALALALLAVTIAVRSAARSVDRAQSAALGRYAAAQIDEATETERVRTDALVHDSVLTTFLSAAAATTPEARRLASRMALNAMNVLSRATVASHTGPKVQLADLLGRTRSESDGIAELFTFRAEGVRGQTLPEQVADSIVLAVVQAMTNSVKHAGDGVARSVTVRGTPDGSVQAIVRDEGRGFAMSSIASERLGVRVSIIERMRRVGGEAQIHSAPGEGTSIVLAWPAAAPHQVERGVSGEVVSA